MNIKNYPLNIYIGGDYCGDKQWSRNRNGSDNCYKIYYLYEGEVIIYDKTTEYTLPYGQLWLVNGHKMQGFKCKDHFRVGWLHFTINTPLLQQAMTTLPLINEIPRNHVLEDLIRLTDQIIHNSTIFNTDLMRLEGLLWIEIASLLEKNNIQILPEKELPFAEIFSYIELHLDRALSLEELATRYHVTPHHFLRQFSKYYRMTPMNYILSQRMSRARQWLLHESVSIKECAYRLGYHDQAYFSRVFKKYYGVSPTEMRISLIEHII